MRIFLDANILISVLNKEYPIYIYSSRILSLTDKRGFTVYTSPICLAIAFYFAEKKSKVRSQIAARDLDLTADDIRKKITEIKTDVHKSFGIPRDAIFENDSDDTGYSVANVSIKDR